MEKQLIYGITRLELADWLKTQQQKAGWVDSIWQHLYQHKVTSFREMADLPPRLTDFLEEHFTFQPLEEVTIQEAEDGTTKFLFRLTDACLIETVLMPKGYGKAVCVTTQIGCNMGCQFCASGLLTKQRDLTAGEIVLQILQVERWLTSRGSKAGVSHITVMGIGEPFDNYDEVMRALRIVTDQRGLCITPSHITVSTSGLAPKIRQFAREGLPVHLAVSLHAPNDEIRSRLMRINRAYPIKELMDALKEYIQLTNRRVFFEYILIRGINDKPEHALELAELIRPLGKKGYVNLIPYNPVQEKEFERSDSEDISRFFDLLMQSGVNCIRRKEMGGDIEGACGQLRSQQLKHDQVLGK